jgi:FKBP-type peptidyl-prolyl cis-trans isomerase FkpA/FKBP-type peptidyl-prolyl cis-trans isomerase FklB
MITLTMKIKNLALFGAVTSTLLIGCAQESSPADESAAAAPSDTPLESLDQRFSYVFGMNVGEQMKQMQSQEINVDIEVFVAGLRDIYDGKDAKLNDEQVQATIEEFQQQQQTKQMAMQAEQQAEMDAAGATNKAEGEAFLAANAEKEGVVALPSGLQYKVITAGTGPKPAATDTVTVHYRGRLLDGTEFDSSYSRNQPATFALNQVIPGWTEGVQLMAEGAKYELYIPADLAYGPGGSGQIGPNSTLIFEVELIKAKAE